MGRWLLKQKMTSIYLGLFSPKYAKYDKKHAGCDKACFFNIDFDILSISYQSGRKP